jgi:hypothetical protein
MPTERLLFIVKERYNYGSPTKSYGLYNSCDFVVRALSKHNIPAKVVQVIDNNYIDAEVAEFKPTICFIEALWVVPSKIRVLAQLHPNVEWVIRLHSMIPFLSNEGMAFEWMNEYMQLRKDKIKVSLSCNNQKLFQYLRPLYKYVSYSPNIYMPDEKESSLSFDYTEHNTMNIGCFGALRPLKNTVQQSILSILFADSLDKSLNFHVNVSEHEQSVATPILKNLREIFSNTNHKLIEHPWYEHQDFLQLVRAMNFGMQISFSETFNITAADFVYCEVPIVVSNEIKFVTEYCRSDVHNDKKILEAMNDAFFNQESDGRTVHSHKITSENTSLLNEHNRQALRDWFRLLDF